MCFNFFFKINSELLFYERSVTQWCLTLCNPVNCVACQAPLSMGFSRQEHWSGLPLFGVIIKVMFPGSGRFPGEGNGNALQYSCLENPVDRGA